MFYVAQGMMTASGCGDFADYGSFESLEEAKARYNEIKYKVAGYNKPPHGYLETVIYEDDFENQLYSTEYRWWLRKEEE